MVNKGFGGLEICLKGDYPRYDLRFYAREYARYSLRVLSSKGKKIRNLTPERFSLDFSSSEPDYI